MTRSGTRMRASTRWSATSMIGSRVARLPLSREMLQESSPFQELEALTRTLSTRILSIRTLSKRILSLRKALLEERASLVPRRSEAAARLGFRVLSWATTSQVRKSAIDQNNLLLHRSRSRLRNPSSGRPIRRMDRSRSP